MSPAEADAGADFPPVLTTADAAELLQVHVEYLRKLVRDGDGSDTYLPLDHVAWAHPFRE